MIWTTTNGITESPLSRDFHAVISFREGEGWVAEIAGVDGGLGFTCESEEAAKHAVCHWIGRTMAQFSMALAAGFPLVDEE